MASVWEGVGAQIPAPASASSTSPQDIQQEVKVFLQGATCQRKVPVDSLAQSALFLLQRVPAARHAVLEHFCNVFDDAAGTYIRQLDQKVEEKSEVAVLQDVGRVLLNFISTTPDAWAPIVSSWSLSLLGQISSKYAKRRALTMSSSLNDVLQLWMTCPPTKLLMDLATECFAAMVGGAPDSCVDALLEASVQYSPHFDWVVARIGSCYPTTIITRVLNCGLKDFCSAGRGDPTTERDPGARKKVPKMASVVGILGHLASKHQQDIRKALMALFEEGLQSSGDAMRVTTVPFLLQLASMSPMLLQVLTTDLISALTPAVLNRLHHQFLSWAMASPGDYNSFLSLVVHLLTKCDVGAFDILSFIVSAAAPADAEPAAGEQVMDEVQETCVELINMLLFELQRGVHGKRRDGMGELPLLEGLSRETDKLVPLLLQSAESKRLPWLEKLLVFTAVRSGQNFSAAVLSRIIVSAATPAQLALYFHIQESIEKSLKNVAKATVDNLFGSMATSQGPQLVQTLRNLERVVQGEQKRNQALKASESYLTSSVHSNLHKVCDVLQHPDVAVSVAGLRLLSSVGVPPSTHIAVLSHLAAVVVSVLFRVLWARVEKGCNSREAGRTGVQRCQVCIRQLGCQPFTQSQLLHYLLAGALSPTNRELFGGKAPVAASSSDYQDGGGDTRGDLLYENRRIGLSMQLPRTHASVFHAGVIGQGLKRRSHAVSVTKDWTVRNQDTLLEAVAACCQSSDSHTPTSPTPTPTPAPTMASTTFPLSADARGAFSLSTSLVPPVLSEAAARTLGCALVEAATMDTLYNDVNWPDPEFSKVTLERDLHVWKQMEDHPVLWSILRAVSGSSVFLYYCSPVLKSLMAKVLSALETTRVKRMGDLPLFYQRACWLVRVLAQGKFLPAPLANIGELFPFITPYEGHLLLVTVWRYIKENPPTLNVEQMEARKCETHHCQVVQAVLNSNIHIMGHLYPRIFNT
ncbi:integrator complex subunit 5-like isoform X2 [Babylonia areolata]|uniref:integrator complex subunit 5-like isoform X1 n=1 Tax=Babylonia areolata TaxID=304850 RepID=UPI003FD692E9